MTIEERIEHEESMIKIYQEHDDKTLEQHHRQLLGWLKELQRYREMIPKIKGEILDEQEFAYADFDQYKIDVLDVEPEYVKDEHPQDDYRFGMLRCIEIINKHIKEVEE